jgi:hypothetical protein
VPVILIDANIEGHGTHIHRRMLADPWRELTTELDVTFRSFREVGLAANTPDNLIWRFCQERGLYLLTSNRNEDTEDSLGMTIRREGTTASLPVFTLPLPDRVFHSPAFLERVVEKLLDSILFAEKIRGSGRLYVP